ncbi:MAG: hypothetical protein PHO84_02520 [Dysgonamonadaceae bacterium]|jgi:hypothetical protein|nr:hypothetical protein [Dysgonamonadaceae bacterium]MDD3355665.1 hypothetical protein [Dysgonamonadaceae bacterium]MDD4246008.1 hypothetical protein [Dysgonamonadaceae bacterium]MDD4605706.1 hypothetical protein [Dysgonamonadaceae bacterium]
MIDKPFTYKDFEHTRTTILKLLHETMNEKDKEFLMAFKQSTPNWGIYDFEKFPSVRWKQKNILHLKNENPEKHKKTVEKLKHVLRNIGN